MKRINVIGTTGSGKSTFSYRLANKLGYPYIQMDQLFWKANWQETSDEELFPQLANLLSTETWVLDGNYSRTSTIKWNQVDTIIWLDFSYSRTLYQLLKRTVLRACTREELWPETGNRESFAKSFLSSDSIIMWFFRGYKKNRVRYLALLNSPNYHHIHFVHLRNPRDVVKWFENI